jgi:hypothetical protein
MRFAKNNDVLGTTNRGNPAESSLCTLCRADCMGQCETWKSSLVGRKLLYPRDFGVVTAGANNTTHVGVSYNSLRIQGYAYGAHGMAQGLSNDADNCIFPNVDLTTEFGNEIKTKSQNSPDDRRPGVNLHRRQILGFLCHRRRPGRYSDRGRRERGRRRQGIGNQKRQDHQGPELDRRIDTYLRYQDEYGAIIRSIERGRHPQRRCRVCGRKIRRPLHR